MTSTRRIVLAFFKIADLIVMAACLLGALVLAVDLTGATNRPPILDVQIRLRDVLLALVYFSLWHFVLVSRGLYESYRLAAAAREWRDLFLAVCTCVALLVPTALLLEWSARTAIFLVSFGALTLLALGITRRILHGISRQIRLRYGRNLRNVIIVGSGDRALDLASHMVCRGDLGYRVVNVINVEPDRDDSPQPQTATDQVLARIALGPVDEIFLAMPIDMSQAVLASIIAVCDEQGITVRVLAQVASLHWSHARVDEIDGQPVLTMTTGRADPLRLVVKRSIDVVAASIALFLLSPLFVLIAIAVKADSSGPIFFAQERVGHKRRRFLAYKFRTMVEGAERLQHALEGQNEANGPVFKIADDPRITRLGRWLRRTSLDELPQLLNVISGEMSLVGPRPLPVRDADRIDVRWHQRRFGVKPGITCLWQVNSRRPVFDEWIRYDMEYIDNWSLALDFKILAKTIPAVLSGEGAR